jgi:hypothetical protein
VISDKSFFSLHIAYFSSLYSLRLVQYMKRTLVCFAGTLDSILIKMFNWKQNKVSNRPRCIFRLVIGGGRAVRG